MILKVIFSLYFVLEVMERVNTGCSTQPYVNTKGLTCYPCSPGFRVLMECNSNGSTNMCAPCASDEFQPNCEKRATSCRKCSSCNRPHLTVSKNCTHEHDTVCNCTEGWYWDTYEAICRSSEPGKHIVKDAECTELPTGALTSTTEKGTTVTTAEAETTKTANTNCECSECEGQYNIIVVLLSAILLIVLILTYPRLKIFLAYVGREIAKRCKARDENNPTGQTVADPAKETDADPVKITTVVPAKESVAAQVQDTTENTSATPGQKNNGKRRDDVHTGLKEKGTQTTEDIHFADGISFLQVSQRPALPEPEAVPLLNSLNA